MLGFFETLTDEHALALVMDLLHVEFRLFTLPAEDGLENVRDINHQIHRIVPADHQETRVLGQFGFDFSPA